MKTLKEQLRETLREEAIKDNSIDKEDDIEYTDKDLNPIILSVKKWLSQFTEEYKGTVGFCEAFIGVLEKKIDVTSYGKTVNNQEK